MRMNNARAPASMPHRCLLLSGNECICFFSETVTGLDIPLRCQWTLSTSTCRNVSGQLHRREFGAATCVCCSFVKRRIVKKANFPLKTIVWNGALPAETPPSFSVRRALSQKGQGITVRNKLCRNPARGGRIGASNISDNFSAWS